MKTLYSYLFLIAACLFAGCEKEEPFKEISEEEGQISKTALGIDLRDDELLQTRADADVNLDDFKITFTKVGSSTAAAVYRFGDMPDVITLAKGTYTAKAEYGDDVIADWNSPFYAGESETFTIEPGKITDDIGDIICRMENVKVSIAFAPILTEKMSEDSYVEVRVCQTGNEAASNYLRFNKNDQLRGNAGHFHHEEGVSLVATFRGLVEGLETTMTKTYAQIQKGCHYKITFKLNTQDSEHRGDVTGGLSVDASVTVTDVERNVDIDDDDILDDNERPKEEDDEPENPVGPGTWSGPFPTADAPLKLPAQSEWTPVNGKLQLTCKHTVDMNEEKSKNIVLNILSDFGFNEFYADIESPALTPDELAGVGLSSHLDLVKEEINKDGDSIWEILSGLGLPTNVKGSNSVKFDISGFMDLLGAIAESGSQHKFIIHAKDGKGELIVNLVLNFK